MMISINDKAYQILIKISGFAADPTARPLTAQVI